MTAERWLGMRGEASSWFLYSRHQDGTTENAGKSFWSRAIHRVARFNRRFTRLSYSRGEIVNSIVDYSDVAAWLAWNVNIGWTLMRKINRKYRAKRFLYFFFFSILCFDSSLFFNGFWMVFRDFDRRSARKNCRCLHVLFLILANINVERINEIFNIDSPRIEEASFRVFDLLSCSRFCYIFVSSFLLFLFPWIWRTFPRASSANFSRVYSEVWTATLKYPPGWCVRRRE